MKMKVVLKFHYIFFLENSYENITIIFGSYVKVESPNSPPITYIYLLTYIQYLGIDYYLGNDGRRVSHPHGCIFNYRLD